MRLFYALWPDATVQATLGQWARACHGICGGRRVATEKLHVTVAFLGEVADDRYATLIDSAASIGAAGFELVFDRVAQWRHSRIVYAAPGVVPAALATLACDLSERLSAAGLRTEERPFAPHVTLVRDARRPPSGVEFASVVWRVRALSLVETILQDGKPAYRLRESWTLAK